MNSIKSLLHMIIFWCLLILFNLSKKDEPGIATFFLVVAGIELFISIILGLVEDKKEGDKNNVVG